MPSKFCGTPCHTSSRPPTMENGSRIRVVMRTRSAKKLPTSFFVLPARPRMNATQAAYPLAADTNIIKMMTSI